MARIMPACFWKASAAASMKLDRINAADFPSPTQRLTIAQA